MAKAPNAHRATRFFTLAACALAGHEAFRGLSHGSPVPVPPKIASITSAPMPLTNRSGVTNHNTLRSEQYDGQR